MEFDAGHHDPTPGADDGGIEALDAAHSFEASEVPVAREPSERSFHHPSARPDLKFICIGGAFDIFQSIPPILRPSHFSPGKLHDSVLVPTKQNHNLLKSFNPFSVGH
jgi:hypothetical protein